MNGSIPQTGAAPIAGRRGGLAAVAACVLATVAGCGYSPTEADLAVIQPRIGRVLTDPDAARHNPPVGAAIVYSCIADLNLKAAWEGFDPLDVHKGRRIFHRLLADKAITPQDVFVPAEAGDDLLRLAHTPDYIESLDSRQVVAALVGDNYPAWQSPADHRRRTLAAHRTAVGGTVLAAELALVHGLAIHLGGGFSHAFSDRGGQGSLLADVPIAIRSLRRRQLVRRVLVVDLGALQANGLASFLGNDSDSRLLDLFEQDNYPSAKQPESDAVPMPDGLSDGAYQSLLEAHLPLLLDEFKPDLVVYLAGVDVVAGDRVGRTALTEAGLVARDLYVVQQVRSRNIPLAMVLDGGGGRQSWQLHYRSIRGLLRRYAGVPFQTVPRQ